MQRVAKSGACGWGPALTCRKRAWSDACPAHSAGAGYRATVEPAPWLPSGPESTPVPAPPVSLWRGFVSPFDPSLRQRNQMRNSHQNMCGTILPGVFVWRRMAAALLSGR
jgi:hypothetical protein